MTKMDKNSAFSRRAVLKAGGALVVSVGIDRNVRGELVRGERRPRALRPRRIDPDHGVEPEAPPWFTLEAVLPMMTVTVLKGTSSSSATIWPMPA